MLMLNPLWLRSFHALVEQGSFTRAADQLELTQAAVSQHVQKLEAELGALFIRRPRQLELTPAGHALVDYLGERAEVDQRLKLRLAGDRDDHGEISLMTPGSIGLALYPRLLELQKCSPGLCIRHRFGPTQVPGAKGPAGAQRRAKTRPGQTRLINNFLKAIYNVCRVGIRFSLLC